MYKQIVKLILASLVCTSTHAMDIKPLSLGLGALASLAALAYAYTQKSASKITIIPEHTPGKDGKPEHYFLFTLYQPSTRARIGSISATYTPLTESALLEFLQVAHKHQNHGYGAQLYEHMISALKKENIKTVTWKAVPADMLPSAAGSDEYQQKLDSLVAWYQKRGAIVTDKNSTEAYMKMVLA